MRLVLSQTKKGLPAAFDLAMKSSAFGITSPASKVFIRSWVSVLGSRWEQGTCSVAEEHNASKRLQHALWACGATLPSPPEQPICILSSVEVSLAKICLREAGWANIWLGSPSPTKVLVSAIQEFSPDQPPKGAPPALLVH